MCGIAGILDSAADESRADELRAVAGRMATTIAHRGPDDEGVWVDAAAGIALAHRRLAIIDLSAAGHQPMASASGRYRIVFNGEIYNFRALRARLGREGAQFRGHSDTEVLLAAIEAYGLEAALRDANGMFAFALWDRVTRTLALARDRVGKKPLYYGWRGDVLAFGSELKALLAFPGPGPAVERGALQSMLRFNYVPSPWSILEGVFKVPPGAIVHLTAADVAAGAAAHRPLAAARAFWDPRERATHALATPFAGSVEDALARLDTLLRDAVRIRLESDVPLGAFLSGGVDSSLVTALMQGEGRAPVRTFSIGFQDPRRDEAPAARAVAQHLGTAHTEFYVSGDDALATIPDLAQVFDEPFADSSQIPTMLVARLARRDVTVALSGDGGDELFGGYRRYGRALRIARWLEATPAFGIDALRRMLRPWTRLEPRGSALRQLAQEVGARTPEDTYLLRMSRWRHPDRVVRGGVELQSPYDDPARRLSSGALADRYMFLDFVTYLPDDILVKVDRSTMAVGLEARAPLLDHRIAEFAWSLPLDMKLRGSSTKWLLRRLLARHVPEAIVERNKQGFGAPVADWLRGPLRDWAEGLLATDRLRREGYFETTVVRDLWAQFQGGNRKWHTHLWNVLMFQAWLDASKVGRA
ncbi:MAG: Asparagine synthetase [glutamine-hydrolyzing] 1 [Steroidobacteraceae bacterium]|nr:Asparagine synthetase [glutamine-hydrolyzing] 1 [Steroidobacteraceae bacterium]